LMEMEHSGVLVVISKILRHIFHDQGILSTLI
jgi:hypothetical protein